MKTITFYDKMGNRQDFCEFGLLEGENELDKLEEVLYIMAEIVPLNWRGWKNEITSWEKCAEFTYHMTEFFTVWITPTGDYQVVEQ